MKDKIPAFLQEKLNLRGYAKTDKFPDEIKTFMIQYSNYYDWGLDDNLTKIFTVMKQGITALPICEIDGCENRVKFDYYYKLTKGCCSEHNKMVTMLEKYGVDNPNKSPEIKEKIKNTNLKRYGGTSPSHCPNIKEKMKQSNLEKYGYESSSSSPIVIEKRKATNLKKYGTTHSITVDVIEKMKVTMLTRYGETSPMRVPELKEKIKQTNLKKYGSEFYGSSIEFLKDTENRMERRKNVYLELYGVEHPMKSEIIKNKHKQTCLDTYGVDHHMKLPEIHEKHQRSMFRYKEYIWKTGEVSLVQGNEPIVLRELEEKGYTYEMVLTGATEMPEIWYDFEDSTHRYFPDIYIPTENLLIEVKSPWTVTLNVEKNQAKFSAAKNAGFDFKLEVR